MEIFGRWELMIAWIIMFALFLLFIPFNRKSQKKPASVYLAFVVALAFEMFGIPLSLFLATWGLGVSLPEGILWEHTLKQYIGLWGMYIGFTLNLIGGLLVVFGWKEIHKQYWSKEKGKGKLVTNGVYTYIRHPQYTGFILITSGMLVHWATIPILIMWPILLLTYYRLAKKEEKAMEEEFGSDYSNYKKSSGMFFPRIR
jgi:protein-S-isoprenylcysteine O-methyltransferase Ste14